MHLGATMASGHYVAYTRVCPSSSDYATCSRGLTSSSLHASNSSRPNSERNSGSNSNSSGGILRFFKPKSSSALGTELPNAGNVAPVTLCRLIKDFVKKDITPRAFT
jgi:ubiquitin carboxyl-terminal hydrolase 1